MVFSVSDGVQQKNGGIEAAAVAELGKEQCLGRGGREDRNHRHSSELSSHQTLLDDSRRERTAIDPHRSHEVSDAEDLVNEDREVPICRYRDVSAV